MEKLRIMLADDQALFRQGVAALIGMQPSLEVVAHAANGLEAIQRAREFVPDVILMDIEMPRCNGLEATSTIKQELPNVHIIVLTVSDDTSDLFTAIKRGADGYLLKNLEPHQLFEMLEGIRKGEAPISGTLAARILDEFRQPSQAAESSEEPQSHLTPREIEVLERVVEGLTNKQIAQALSIAEDTVKIHLRNILEKLHLQNRIQAAVYAVRSGLV